MNNTNEIRHYKIQPDGTLKFIKVTQAYERKPKFSYRVVSSCFPRHVGDGNRRQMECYPIRTVVTSRLRTGSNPEVGKTEWQVAYLGWYWINKREVAKYGIVEAHRRKIKRYYAGVRERLDVDQQNTYEV